MRLFTHLFIYCFLLLGLALLPAGCTSGRKAKADAPSNPSGGRESALRRDIVQYAARFKGTPYRYAGKEPRTGFDCSGFTSYVMAHFDIRLSPASREQYKQGKSKPVSAAQPGDLVFFRRGPGQPIFHVALVVDADRNTLRVIHATTSRGVIVEDLLASSYWKPKIDSVRDVIR